MGNLENKLLKLIKEKKIFNQLFYFTGLIYCVCGISLYLLFNDKYSLPEGTNYHLPFFCNNSVEESIEGKIILTKVYDYKLATISRLEKLSVPIICSEIKKFAKRNVNKTILYVIFGGSENSSQSVRSSCRACGNS